MKKILTLCLLITASSALALNNFPLPPTELNTETKMEIREKSSDKVTKKMSGKYTKGNGYLVYTEISQKIKDGKEYDAKRQTFFKLKGKKISIDSVLTEVSLAGASVTKTQINYDWKTKKAIFNSTNYLKDKTTTKNINLTDPTFSPDGFSLYFRDLIINKIKKSSFKLITADGSTFTMSVKVNQTPETLSVKGKEINCYKVTMKPDMGWLSMVLPELNFWYEVKSPHDFVRYAGLESGLGSPDIIQEIIN